MPPTPPRELETLAGFPFPVSHSKGSAGLASRVAARLERAHRFLSAQLAFDPAFLLLVLSPDDWSRISDFPVYSMPHTMNADTLVVGDRPGAFMLNMTQIIESAIPDGHAYLLESPYTTPDGAIDLSPITDILAVHELGHLFHEQVPFNFPRLWLQELFPNVCMYAYVEAEEPEMLQALRTFPELMSAVPPTRWRHRTLRDFDRAYLAIAPENYGWYQCRFIVEAGRIYREGGTTALRNFYTAFSVGSYAEIDDTSLCAVLRDRVGPAAAAVMTDWPATSKAA